MSLYGSGRREGILTTLAIATLVMVVHVLGSWFAPDHTEGLLAALRSAAIPALAGILCYRCLRAFGRSRYAGFLTGTAYALSPWFVAFALVPREQVAAALAPLALEAVARLNWPAQRYRWAPWAGFCLAAPFAAGPAVTALFAAALALALLWRTCVRDDAEQRLARSVPGILVIAVLVGGTLAWLDPLALLFAQPAALQPVHVLAAHRPSELGLDAAALIRLPGPVLLLFAALGLLRNQRHARLSFWIGIGVLGTLPTLLAWFVPFPAGLTAWMTPRLLSSVSWWLALFAVVMLGAAGLDDFLELPQRRRRALPWLLALAVGLVPVILAFGAVAPAAEWPLTGSFLLMGLLMPLWRRVGILRFKNVLATFTLLALAVPALQILPIEAPITSSPAPLAEIEPSDYAAVVRQLAARPPWHYSALALATLASCFWAVSAWRRNKIANPVPTAAKAAITKKARSPQRS